MKKLKKKLIIQQDNYKHNHFEIIFINLSMNIFNNKCFHIPVKKKLVNILE